MTHVANAIIPTDPIIANSTINVACLQLLVLMHVIHSMLMTVNEYSTFSKLCKLL
jgi:hypothetical protein